MNPVAMVALILGLHLVFAYSAIRRWDLLNIGRWENRFDRIPDRIKAVFEYVFAQRKIHYYPLAGLAHHAIFLGFMVLLLRTIILWGRGVYAPFNAFLFGPTQVLGMGYELLKDIVAIVVFSGAAIFMYLRVVKKTRRMTESNEAILILGIIMTMMVSDVMYDGAALVLHSRWNTMGCGSTVGSLTGHCASAATIIAPLHAIPHTGQLEFHPFSPAGSTAAFILNALPTGALVVLAHVGFWTHSSLVLIFLNLLPYSKHFHVITVIPNVFTLNLEPKGKLPKLADNSDELMELVGAAAENEDPLEAPIGIARIEHFSWKAISDFYTCTECGRCSDNCPAHRTGKILSPKQLTLNLRDHLYQRDAELVNHYVLGHGKDPKPEPMEDEENEEENSEEELEEKAPTYNAINLVGDVIHPDVLWACTTCRACEEQCPVMISYVDKIVQMRRNLVVIQGDFPAQLSKPFEGMEVNGNPWNLSRMDRAAWCEGLDIATFAEKPKTEVLFWVGCSASYDDRAKKIARATTRLLQKAKVDFAVLGEEESCTGDPARRAGNEFLFMTLAEANAEILNGYKEQGGIKKIITTCPHCFNTLLNEYPDLGAKFEVVHHADFLLGLVAERKLTPKHGVKGKVVYHDSCYLGRYNDIYESPRELLKAIPGVELVEVEDWNRNKGLCCGAGGAQMFMEEQNKDRVNVKRTLQLVQTQAQTIASACPFCMTMLTDGLKAQELESKIKQMDVAELLAESCLGSEKTQGSSKADSSLEAEAQTPAE
jgi:Fe-S oxidoreductase